MHRNYTLDITRTFAIVLMVVFHFIYDLKFFGFVDWDTPDGFGWQQFRWLIISLFFICLGVSLTFAHERKIRWKKFSLRTSQIAGAALLISVISYFAVPNNWIFFGVLHFLALASVLAIGFVRRPKISLIVGICIVSLGAAQLIPSRWPFYLYFENLPRYTNDFVALFPWLGVVFLGISLAHCKWFKNDPLCPMLERIKRTESSIPKRVEWQKQCLLWPGQHSLSIYLLHQPIMMGMLYLLS